MESHLTSGAGGWTWRLDKEAFIQPLPEAVDSGLFENFRNFAKKFGGILPNFEASWARSWVYPEPEAKDGRKSASKPDAEHLGPHVQPLAPDRCRFCVQVEEQTSQEAVMTCLKLLALLARHLSFFSGGTSFHGVSTFARRWLASIREACLWSGLHQGELLEVVFDFAVFE